MEIVVKLTTGCNLRCVYCSEGNKAPQVLKKEFLYKLIDELPDFLEEHQDRDITLLWHGGEPMTVGTAYLQQVMDYTKEKLAGYDLHFQMQTNLTLLDEAWLQLIKDYHIGIGVSLDGYRELHDANRRDQEGRPTFDRVIAHTQKLREAGIPFGTLMVLNTENEIDVDKLYGLIKENHWQMKIHPVIPCGRAAGNTHAGEIYARYVRIMEILYEKAMSDTDFFGTIEPMEDMMRAILSGGHLRECSYNGSCGEKIMCLFANGEMGFCGRAEGERGVLGFGNIGDNTLADMYDSAHAKRIRSRQKFLKEHGCGKCPEWDLCHGGCSFEALNAFGTLEAQYPNCEERRRFIKYLKTKGLELLKKRLIANRNKYRIIVKSCKHMLKVLENG